jgi:hypothetical protein
LTCDVGAVPDGYPGKDPDRLGKKDVIVGTGDRYETTEVHTGAVSLAHQTPPISQSDPGGADA